MGGRGGSGRSSAAVTPSVPAASIEERTLAAIRSSFVASDTPIASLTDVRRKLYAMGFDRGEQDAELRRLFRAKVINLFPASNQKVLNQEDFDSRISIGNEMKLHVIIQ